MSNMWKKNLCSKKNFRDDFFEIFFMESYSYIYFELFLSFQPFSYYKKCAYLKEVIRRDSDQCEIENPVKYGALKYVKSCDKIWSDITTKSTLKYLKTYLADLPNQPKYLGCFKKVLISHWVFVVREYCKAHLLYDFGFFGWNY